MSQFPSSFGSLINIYMLPMQQKLVLLVKEKLQVLHHKCISRCMMAPKSLTAVENNRNTGF